MRHIKPSKYNSKMGIFGSIIGIVFALFWTVMASQIQPFMAVFGIIVCGICVVQLIYNIKNATSDEGIALYDIYHTKDNMTTNQNENHNYCGNCGQKVNSKDRYCSKCGRAYEI